MATDTTGNVYGNVYQYDETIGGGGSYTVATDSFEITRGDDYTGTRAIVFEREPGWPDLSGESTTVKFGAVGLTDPNLDVSGSVLEDGRVAVELAKTLTATLRDWYSYDLQATIDAGGGAADQVTTLARGRMRARETFTDIPANEPTEAVGLW